MKKVLSLVLALVMVLGMIPTFAADATGAQALYDNEFITGKDGADLEAKLDVNAQLTRAQLAALIAELNGAKEEAAAFEQPADFTDFSMIAGWAKNFVSYAAVNGWMNGFTDGTFRAGASVPAQQLAAVLMNALGYDVVWNTVLADAAKLGIVVEGAALTRGEAFEAMWVAVSEVKMADKDMTLGQFLGKLTPPVVVPTTLVVDSAKAINLKQIVVSFNRDVNKAAAETKTNYTFDGADLAAGDVVALNEDGKSVTITLATNVANQTTKKLIVETGIKTGDLVALAANKTFDVNFTDTTVPFAVKAVQVAPNKIKVFFNEPVQITAGASFLVDNGTLSAVVGTNSATAYSVEVTLGASITSGSHTVTINPSTSTSVKDYAGFAIPTATLTFDAVVDTALPTATVVAESQTELTVKFSEEVTGFTASDIYHTVSGYTANSVTLVAGTTTDYSVIFTTNPLPTGSAVVVIAKDAVTDLFNNKFGAATTYNVPVTADNAAPTVTKVAVTDENTIKVTFSEVVTGSTVSTSYVLKNEAGTVIINKAYANASGNPIGTITYSNKVATIDFAANLPHANYLLEVKNVKDTAVNANTIVTATYAFTIADATKPTVNSLTWISAKKLVVNFSESMAVTGTGSILDTARYTLNGSALPAGTTLTAGVNNSSVVIQLPDSHAGVTAAATMQVGQVADAAGNLTVNLATNLTGSAATAAVIVAGSVEAISTNTVMFELNQPLQNIYVDDFTVNAAPVTSAVYENKTLADGTTYGAVVTLKIAAATPWATNATPSVVVTAVTNGIETKDALGTLIAANAGVVATDLMAPEVAEFTVGTTDYADIKALDLDTDNKLDTIRITYTENIFGASVGIQSYEVEGYTIVNAAAVTNVVTLTVTEKATADTGAAPNVKQILAIQDNLGAGLRNDKAADTAYTASRDSIVPKIASATVTNIAAASVVAVTFTESMKESIAELNGVIGQFTVKNGAAAPAVLTAVAGTLPTLSEDGKVLTIVTDMTFTTNNSFVLGYTIGTLVDNSVLANVLATNTTAVTGTITGAIADVTAPTVVTQLAAAATILGTAVDTTHTLMFSEELNAASKTAVKAAVDAAYTVNGASTVTSAWSGATLTITITPGAATPADDIVLGAVANIAVTDIAGNTSAALDVQL